MAHNKIIALNGEIIDLASPITMSIVNVTPDSFYAASRANDTDTLVRNIEISLNKGAKIIDLGGCSTRPNAEWADEDSEWQRLVWALPTIRSKFSDIAISVDTFRASIARRCIEQFNCAIINDISGGGEEMFDLLAEKQVPYVLTFSDDVKRIATPDLLTTEMLKFFAKKIDQLRQKGFDKEIIIDPGFGFGKTLEQNYWILDNLSVLQCFNAPILIGVSRKSMIYKKNNCTPEQALDATREVEQIAVKNGANIVRTHLI